VSLYSLDIPRRLLYIRSSKRGPERHPHHPPAHRPGGRTGAARCDALQRRRQQHARTGNL